MIVIGYGTGRCGTKSLAGFLNHQEGVNVTHESAPLEWNPALSNQTDAIVALEKRKELVVGDVGYFWIHHVSFLLENFEAKVINITRDDDEVIESFWSYNNNIRTYEPFQDKRWFKYPYNSTIPKRENIEKTVSNYRFVEHKLNEKYGDHIYHLDMYDLNDKKKLNDLLDWLGLSDKKLDIVHENKGNGFFSKNAQTELPA